MEILTWHARNKLNMTLKELEELTGIGKSILNNIENGKTSPTLIQLEAIAKALDKSITSLLIANTNNYTIYKIFFQNLL